MNSNFKKTFLKSALFPAGQENETKRPCEKNLVCCAKNVEPSPVFLRLFCVRTYIVIETSHPIYTGIIKGLIGGWGSVTSIHEQQRCCILYWKKCSNGKICPKQQPTNVKLYINIPPSDCLLVLSIRSTDWPCLPESVSVLRRRRLA